MFRNAKRLILVASVAVGAAAVYEQMQRPPEERTWYGKVLGVPYDFRPPSVSRFMGAWWNPDDARLLTPRDFGIGWAVNLHRASVLAKRAIRDEPDEYDI